MTDSTSIRLVNVHKSFRNGRDQVLRGINIDFPEKKLTYVLGPSGTGKSVAIKHILGLLKPDSGEVWVMGNDVSKLRGRNLERSREAFGMLFQNSALFDDQTVFDNVAFPLYEHTKLNNKQVTERVEKALAILGMTKGYDKYPNELSGGMRKRVGLARAIIREPQILLYDEPTTGLDPVTRNTVDELIGTLKRDLLTTSIVISHDIPSALKLADQIVFLHDGTAAFTGTPTEFRKCTIPVVRQFLDAEMLSYDVLNTH